MIMYYRPSGDGGIGADVVSALGPVATGNHATYLIPYSDLAERNGLRAHGMEQADHVSRFDHRSAGRDAVARVRGFVRVHQQRTGRQARGRLLARHDRAGSPAGHSTRPCSKAARVPPPVRGRTRVIGKPSEPAAPPRRGRR